MKLKFNYLRGVGCRPAPGGVLMTIDDRDNNSVDVYFPHSIFKQIVTSLVHTREQIEGYHDRHGVKS